MESLWHFHMYSLFDSPPPLPASLLLQPLPGPSVPKYFSFSFMKYNLLCDFPSRGFISPSPSSGLSWWSEWSQHRDSSPSRFYLLFFTEPSNTLQTRPWEWAAILTDHPHSKTPGTEVWKAIQRKLLPPKIGCCLGGDFPLSPLLRGHPSGQVNHRAKRPALRKVGFS